MSARADFAFLHPLRVRWNECDAQGIVFNANYFVYYDIAIWEWTRALGYPRYTDAPEFVTAHAECDYLGSALFDDEGGIVKRMVLALMEGVSTGSVETERLHDATGYVAFGNVLLYLLGLSLLPSGLRSTALVAAHPVEGELAPPD